jgi:hypothetical protein
MKISKRKGFTAIVAVSSLFFLFQNCAPAKITSSESESAVLNSVDQGSNAPPSATPTPGSTPAPTPVGTPAPTPIATPTPVPTAVIKVSTNLINFGTVRTGSLATSRQLVVTNTGTAVLRITSKSINVQEFREDTFSSTCQFTLNPGASCNIVILYEPFFIETTTGILRLDSNASNGLMLVQLQGTLTF